MAAKLNREWAAPGSAAPASAHLIADYYRAVQTAYVRALRDKGLSDAQIGTHAGAADTSLLMAIDTTLVRADRMAPGSKSADTDGVAGDPRAASAALGQIGVDLIVRSSVAAIRQATNADRANRATQR